MISLAAAFRPSALLLAAAAVVRCVRLDDEGEVSVDFPEYMAAYGRDYVHGSEEYRLRAEIFRQRVEHITAHNARPGRTWTAAVNHLTDRTEEELAQLRGWRRGPESNGGGGGANLLEISDSPRLPKAVDWRSLKMASDVPDQGQCGSCWAVTTAAILQAHKEIWHQESRKFSAQQLVNCVDNPRECGGQGGCKGATVELAMEYIRAVGLGEDEPYTAQDGKCTTPIEGHHHQSVTQTGSFDQLGISHWRTLEKNQAYPLMVAVQRGPVAISVSGRAWATYGRGIFNGCVPDVVIDHAVALFGYGVDSGKEYWLVRNSWGKLWGEEGFIRLTRSSSTNDDDNSCGVDTQPGEGVECKPYPNQTTVCGQCGLLADSVAVYFGSNGDTDASYQAAYRKALNLSGYPKKRERSRRHKRKPEEWTDEAKMTELPVTDLTGLDDPAGEDVEERYENF